MKHISTPASATRPPHAVAGISAPAVRPTPLAAALVAAAIALPGGLLVQIIYWMVV